MNTLPVKLLIKISAGILVICLVVQFVLRPLLTTLTSQAGEVINHYSSSNKSAVAAAIRQRTILRALEKKIAAVAAVPGKSASSYDFLNEFLKARGIQAYKVTGGSGESAKGMLKNDYSIEYVGTYPSLGSLIGDLENGPFVCEVTSMKAAAKSSVSNSLNIKVGISFFRMAR